MLLVLRTGLYLPLCTSVAEDQIITLHISRLRRGLHLLRMLLRFHWTWRLVRVPICMLRTAIRILNYIAVLRKSRRTLTLRPLLLDFLPALPLPLLLVFRL